MQRKLSLVRACGSDGNDDRSSGKVFSEEVGDLRNLVIFRFVYCFLLMCVELEVEVSYRSSSDFLCFSH